MESSNSNKEGGEMVSIYDVHIYNENKSRVSVGRVKEHPNSLYVAREMLIVDGNFNSNYPTYFSSASSTTINTIIGVIGIDKYEDKPLNEKYMKIILDNSRNSKSFAIFKEYLGSLMPETSSDWHTFEGIEGIEGIKHYGGSYSCPKY
jgi:hypothetical protein